MTGGSVFVAGGVEPDDELSLESDPASVVIAPPLGAGRTTSTAVPTTPGCALGLAVIRPSFYTFSFRHNAAPPNAYRRAFCVRAVDPAPAAIEHIRPGM